jgi:hypothetical protein
MKDIVVGEEYTLKSYGLHRVRVLEVGLRENDRPDGRINRVEVLRLNPKRGEPEPFREPELFHPLGSDYRGVTTRRCANYRIGGLWSEHAALEAVKEIFATTKERKARLAAK